MLKKTNLSIIKYPYVQEAFLFFLVDVDVRIRKALNANTRIIFQRRGCLKLMEKAILYLKRRVTVKFQIMGGFTGCRSPAAEIERCIILLETDKNARDQASELRVS